MQLGLFPRWEMLFDLSPVDYLAQSIVALSLARGEQQRVFHLHNPRPLSWVEYVSHLREMGYAFNIVEPKTWHAALLGIDESNAIFDVVSFYLDERNEDIGDMSRFAHERTQECLRRVQVEYPAKDRLRLRRDFEYLQRCGFLPPPPRPERAQDFRQISAHQ